ncbi:hypothetical protein EDD16DRAFT_177315 [Pisolithus croceorrhizus]|nr:hypothetical protein EDD16DRAFT_177315 [Pisolithus croceorrhizus]KAI6165234.1 hypothetical protein EDD17DRAFT_1754451 [Pisolithus thermaeus]
MDPIDDLRAVAFRLQQVRSAIHSFQPRLLQPPILETPAPNATLQADDESLSRGGLPGLRILREEVNRECVVLERFLQNLTRSEGSPRLSANAPYLIAVWQELVYSHRPIALYRNFFPGNRSQGRKLSSRPVKVDVVSENGARWIRVNTIKNSRLVTEFRELDSYLTSSSEEDGDNDDRIRHGNLTCPTASQQLENSVLQMARELLAAAAANPLPISGHIPQVTLRLTRLNPTLVSDSVVETDPRIARTVTILRDMGIDVQLGERSEVLPDNCHEVQQIELEPTSNINLDLSALIALVSDITHAPLPRSPDEVGARFKHWKLSNEDMSTGRTLKTASNHDNNETYDTAHCTGRRSTEENEQTRALSRQATQEMRKGLLQDMYERLSSLGRHTPNAVQPGVPDVFSGSPTTRAPGMSNVKFWTTQEARQRCLQIVAKIGGPRERRRAHALLAVHDCSRPSEAEERRNKAAAEAAYWGDSRYPLGYLPLTPVHVLSSCHAVACESGDGSIRAERISSPSSSPYFSSLSAACANLLVYNTDFQSCAQRPIIPKKDLPDLSIDSLVDVPPPTLINSKLTAHTVESMYAGASRGWTTLTANRTSVRMVLKEIDKRGDFSVSQHSSNDTTATSPAVIWLVEPRSLAEGMRVDNDG